MNNFPYPVLTENDSAYSDDCVFKIDYIKSEIEDDFVKLYFSLRLTSSVLEDYVATDAAAVVLKVQSELFSGVYKATLHNGNIEIKMLNNLLKDKDLISVVANIYAKEDIRYLWNDEINIVYPESYATNIRKNDILAISNKIKLDYTAANSNFIKFVVSDDAEKLGIKVKLSNENFIEVVIGPSLNHAYAITKKDSKVSPVFSSHIVFEVFVYTLIELIQQQEMYQEKEWYRLFDNLLISTTGDSIDDFIEKAKDEYIDMGQVYDVAQKLINNQLEDSLIRVSKSEDKYGSSAL